MAHGGAGNDGLALVAGATAGAANIASGCAPLFFDTLLSGVGARAHTAPRPAPAPSKQRQSPKRQQRETPVKQNSYAFDTVKVRLQTGRFDGMAHCFRHIVRTEGVRGLYRGLTPPLVGGAAETGVNYLVYGRLLRELSARMGDGGSSSGSGSSSASGGSGSGSGGSGGGPPPLRAVPLAGAGAGVALSFVLSPAELLKCRLQTTEAHFPGPLACLRALLREEGPRGLWRGLGATMAREVPGNAVFFSAYEALRRAPWWGGAGRGGGGGSGGGGGGGSAAAGAAAAGGGGAGGGAAGGGNVGADGPVARALAAARGAGSAIVCGGLAGVIVSRRILPPRSPLAPAPAPCRAAAYLPLCPNIHAREPRALSSFLPSTPRPQQNTTKTTTKQRNRCGPSCCPWMSPRAASRSRARARRGTSAF